MNISSDLLFKYVCIILFLILFFSYMKTISINSIIAVILGVIVCWYINGIVNEKKIEEKDDIELKYESLRIKPKKKYPDIIEFLYEIKDLGNFNLQEYQNMIKHLDNFFTLFEDMNNVDYSLDQPDQIKYSFDNLKDIKKDILNILHSIVFNLEIDMNNVMIEHLNNDIGYLDNLLSSYMEVIFKKIEPIKNINRNTKIIDEINQPEYFDLKTTDSNYYIYS